MKKANCVSCFKTDLDKDTIGINKKLLGLNVKEFYCMTLNIQMEKCCYIGLTF